jgi:hypothetical protein
MIVSLAFSLLVFVSVALGESPPLASNQLLMGTLVRQGSSKNEVLQGQKGVEEVKGKEVGKSADESVDPPNELMVGQSLGEFQAKPAMREVYSAIRKEMGVGELITLPKVENKKGTVLDSNVKSGRYVPNPLKVIGEIKAADLEMPEIMEGEVLAGDPAELDVLTLNK